MFGYWIIFITICGVLLLSDIKRPRNYPPGPSWIPIIGNYFLYKTLHKKLGFTHLVWQKFYEIYGQVVGLRMGRDKVIIVSGQSVKDVLTCKDFDARPDGFFFRLRSFGERYGLVFIDGEYFNEQKKFCMKHLRSFGLLSQMEERINMEKAELISLINDNAGKEIEMLDKLEVYVLNGLWSVVAGHRFSTDDSVSEKLMQLIHTSFRLQDMSGGIINQMPFIRFIAPQASSYNSLIAVLDALHTFIKQVIEEHKKHNNCVEDNRDLVDAYLQEIESAKNNNQNSTFTEKQIIVSLLDLFLAGTETTSSTIGYAILYLIHYPDIQRKIQQEMDNEVGVNRSPSLQDRPRLKYLEAFLMEVQRQSNVTPTTVAHRAQIDSIVAGFTIPKDSIVIGNLYSLHMDKKHWGDPECFRPERFLDKDGNIIQDDWLMPFGAGKRRCMGEKLAKASLYLFVTSILHNFNVTVTDLNNLPTLLANDGATISPKTFKCIFQKRF